VSVEIGARIRVAEPGDEPAIVDILVKGLGAKLLPAFGKAAGRAVAAMVRYEVSHPDAAYRVASEDGRVLGVVHLDSGTTREPSLLTAIRREVGWVTTARATAVLAALAPPLPRHDEAVVEELAVHPEARRRGIASALLDRCEHDAMQLGKSALILQVTTDNDAAIGLYREFGFQVRSRRRWRMRRRLFHSPGALIMEKSLE
jgi:ribosomal protein S18 acetylase RimI-like enzyme